MDAKYFDVITHFVADRPSRRDILRGLASAGLGLATLRMPAIGHARKKPKRKKKSKLQRNEFGCVNVGGKCLGNSANCCSGICEGKKPRRGKADKSRCIGHDSGTCFPDSDSCTAGAPILCNSDLSCSCMLTTGNAGFCADFTNENYPDPPFFCRDCTSDTDCQEEFGPGSACLSFQAACTPFCPDTGRTGCMRPCPEEAP